MSASSPWPCQFAAMVLPLLPIVDNLNLCCNSLSEKTLNIIGQVLIHCTSENKDEIVPQLACFSNANLDIIVDVVDLSSDNSDSLISILDAGASKIIVSTGQLKELLVVPIDRILIRVSDENLETVSEVENIANISSGIILNSAFYLSVNPETLSSIVQNTQKSLLPNGGQRKVYMEYSNTPPTIPELKFLALLSIEPIIPSKYLTSLPKENPTSLSIAQIALLCAKTDRQDGLYATLVVDEQNHALGLVYSSPESVAESIKTGTGVYQSRQRGLWYKGATSGATQELLNISWDCDSDCLRFTVRQAGKGTSS